MTEDEILRFVLRLQIMLLTDQPGVGAYWNEHLREATRNELGDVILAMASVCTTSSIWLLAKNGVENPKEALVDHLQQALAGRIAGSN